jgi:hypothetical protein
MREVASRMEMSSLLNVWSHNFNNLRARTTCAGCCIVDVIMTRVVAQLPRQRDTHMTVLKPNGSRRCIIEFLAFEPVFL